MFRFNAETMSGISDDNEEVALGVAWTEDREWLSESLMQLQMLLVVGFFALIFLGSFDSPDQALLHKAAAGLFALEVFVLVFGHAFCTVRRSLFFCNNGAIDMPQGKPGWFTGSVVHGDLRDIATFQAQPIEWPVKQRVRKKYEVWVYFSDGSTECVAEQLFEWQARHLAVLLETERLEMRSRMARIPGQTTRKSELIE